MFKGSRFKVQGSRVKSSKVQKFKVQGSRFKVQKFKAGLMGKLDDGAVRIWNIFEIGRPEIKKGDLLTKTDHRLTVNEKTLYNRLVQPVEKR